MRIQRPNKGLCAVLGIVAACGLWSCSNRPEGVLSDNKTVELLADMYIADAYTAQNAGDFPTDSAKKGFRQSVLLKHGVSQKELDRTLDWYGRHLDLYAALYEKVDRKLAERTKEYNKRQSSDNGADDSNLWNHSKVLRLAPAMMHDAITFEIDDDNLKKGDRFIWSMRIANYNSRLQAFIAAEYDDNYTYSLSRDISAAGRTEIEFITDSAKSLKRVYGYLRLKGSSPAWIDSIRITKASFDRKKYHKLDLQTVFSPTQKNNLQMQDAEKKINEVSAAFNPNVEVDDGTSLPASLGRSHIHRPKHANPEIAR